MNIELIEVRPLKPFVGSYKCPLSEADTVEDELHEIDGYLAKRQVAKKKFAGQVAYQRRLITDEVAAFLAGTLPAEIEVIGGQAVLDRQKVKPQSANVIELVGIIHPTVRTVKVPSDIATSLVERGLAELVGPKRRMLGKGGSE